MCKNYCNNLFSPKLLLQIIINFISKLPKCNINSSPCLASILYLLFSGHWFIWIFYAAAHAAACERAEFWSVSWGWALARNRRIFAIRSSSVRFCQFFFVSWNREWLLNRELSIRALSERASLSSLSTILEILFRCNSIFN